MHLAFPAALQTLPVHTPGDTWFPPSSRTIFCRTSESFLSNSPYLNSFRTTHSHSLPQSLLRTRIQNHCVVGGSLLIRSQKKKKKKNSLKNIFMQRLDAHTEEQEKSRRSCAYASCYSDLNMHTAACKGE